MRFVAIIITSQFVKNTKSTQLDIITYGIEKPLFPFGLGLKYDTQ